MILRILSLCFMALLLSSCQTFSYKNNNLDFDFYDAGQLTRYQISTVGDQIQAKYPSLKKPIIVTALTANPAKSDEVLWEQYNVFDHFDGEEYQYIFIIGSSAEPYTSGYNVATDTAQSLLENESFKILIFNRDAQLVTEKNSVMDFDEVKKYLDAMQ
ncbi:MAG: hypothetical protein P8X74_22590 [Reinekea sp.]